MTKSLIDMAVMHAKKDSVRLERQRCVAIVKLAVHFAKDETTKHALEAVIKSMENDAI